MIIKIPQFFSKISFRLLVFNVLLVFLPIMGLLYLDTYEKQLLIAQERSMVQQGRLLSAALSHQGELNHGLARKILLNLEQKIESRLRIVDRNGNLVADSSVIPSIVNESNSRELKKEEKQNWLYEIASLPIRFYRKYFEPPNPSIENIDYYRYNSKLLGPEIQAAFEDQYQGAWRISSGGQRSVTIYSALPIKNKKIVMGAVLVSQSTYKILKDLYEVRLGIFKIFLISIVVAIIISIFMAGTIAWPVRRLRNEAEEILDHRGRLTRPFKEIKKRDEIGDLSRSLKELTSRLENHILFIESFASDLSHEFRNPLAAVRAASDVLKDMKDVKERDHFLNLIDNNVKRMEKLLTEAKEITRIDTNLPEEDYEPVDLHILILNLVEGFKLVRTDIDFYHSLPANNNKVYGNPNRIAQVLENIISNAVSFSPDNGEVGVSLKNEHSFCVICISDHGPGIPVEHRDKIFNRFFCYRPENDSNEHSGLGLSIVKAIVAGYKGSVSVENREEGGTLFIVRFPIYKKRKNIIRAPRS